MKNYTKKQITFWVNSRFSLLDDDGSESRPFAFERDALSDLFRCGFSLVRKTPGMKWGKGCFLRDGNGTLMAVHSPSLAKALRKRAKEHNFDLFVGVKEEMRSVLENAGKLDDSAKKDFAWDPVLGCNQDHSSAKEQFILHGTVSGRYYIFARKTWDSPLELEEIIIK